MRAKAANTILYKCERGEYDPGFKFHPDLDFIPILPKSAGRAVPGLDSED